MKRPSRTQIDRILDLAAQAGPDDQGVLPDGEELVGLALSYGPRMAQTIIRDLTRRIAAN